MVIFGFEHNDRYPDAEPVPYTELVNPVLTPLTDEMEEAGRVACRSLGCAVRYRASRACATPASIRTGTPIEREVDGFHARVVQHECDHLDGVLYPMRMRDMRTFGYTDVLFPDAEVVDD